MLRAVAAILVVLAACGDPTAPPSPLADAAGPKTVGPRAVAAAAGARPRDVDAMDYGAFARASPSPSSPRSPARA